MGRALMHGARLSRRALLASCVASTTGWALGRRRYGGTLRLVLPWRITRIDPQDLWDAGAALFAAGLCDPLYALDALGRPYPALASELPETRGNAARVTLRSDLVTARGTPLTAADMLATFNRLGKRAARVLLFGVDAVRRVPGMPLSLDFQGLSATALATRLASPLCAVLPRNFSPLEPDGTGPFRAELGRGRLRLVRNPHAARGAAFLDSVEVDPAQDLAECLRAFEAGSADVGWLGGGLHRTRAAAVPFSGKTFGWAVLRTGRDAQSWSAPGVAQQLVDGIEPDRLRHLGLAGLPARALPSPGWNGGNAEVCVADDAPQLSWIAASLAVALSRPAHELKVRALPAAELWRLRESGKFTLMVDFVRALGPAGPLSALSLFAAHNPDAARTLPELTDFDARHIARRLPFGVLGELSANGAHGAEFRALSGWDLGEIWKNS